MPLKLAENHIESITDMLNSTIYLGKDNWESIILSLLSTHAPKIHINGITQRANIHINMIGEISTAKSTVLKIIRKISPKSITVTRTTEASFEGISKAKEIAPGLIEHAQDGVLLIPEFKRALGKFQLLREAMDCDEITLNKRGVIKVINVNTSFIAASNPKDDFFNPNTIMRKDIPFEEGILSRFDFLIPLIITPEKNTDILGGLNLFGMGPKKVNFDQIRLYMKMIQDLMVQNVERVVITETQQNLLKETYNKHNYMIGNRPLVILRDAESLCRIVNVLVACNHFARTEVEEGVYQAKDVDVDKAIAIWNTMVSTRKQLYEMNEKKEILYPQDKILTIIKGNKGKIPTKDLLNKAIAEDICSKATFYRYLNDLHSRGEIKLVDEKKNTASVQLIV